MCQDFSRFCKTSHKIWIVKWECFDDLTGFCKSFQIYTDRFQKIVYNYKKNTSTSQDYASLTSILLQLLPHMLHLCLMKSQIGRSFVWQGLNTPYLSVFYIQRPSGHSIMTSSEYLERSGEWYIVNAMPSAFIIIWYQISILFLFVNLIDW